MLGSGLPLDPNSQALLRDAEDKASQHSFNSSHTTSRPTSQFQNFQVIYQVNSLPYGTKYSYGEKSRAMWQYGNITLGSNYLYFLTELIIYATTKIEVVRGKKLHNHKVSQAYTNNPQKEKRLALSKGMRKKETSGQLELNRKERTMWAAAYYLQRDSHEAMPILKL